MTWRDRFRAWWSAGTLHQRPRQLLPPITPDEASQASSGIGDEEAKQLVAKAVTEDIRRAISEQKRIAHIWCSKPSVAASVVKLMSADGWTCKIAGGSATGPYVEVTW